MPRTLPWLTNGAAKNVAKTSSPTPKRRKRESSPEDLVDADLNDIATPPPRPKQKKRAERTPPTSPAPAPPDVEYMLPGYGADDIYMMVEDEFNTTAKAYTKHIHYAEYVRLKKLAKSRGERTLSAMEHGTDSRTGKSRVLQLREEREASERRREELVGVEEESEEDDPYLQDPQLAGLMMRDSERERDRGVGRELNGMVKAKSKTRAAAGFLESPHKAERHRDALKDEEIDRRQMQKPAKATNSRPPAMFEEVSDDDEDDLDAVPVAKSGKGVEATGNEQENDLIRKRKPHEGRNDHVFKRFAASSKEGNSTANDVSRETSTPPSQLEDDDNIHPAPRPKPARPTYKKAQNRQASQALIAQDASLPKRSPLRPTGSESGAFPRRSQDRQSSEAAGTTTPSPPKKVVSPLRTSPDQSEARAAAASYLAKRAADRARKEKEQQGRTKRVDDIPTFLF